jgi:hypothetical protein
VNSSNLFADSGEVKVGAFDHLGGKLYHCFAGRLFCAMSLLTTISLTPSAAAACCMVIHSRRSGGGQAGKPFVWRTCCTRFSVQVLPLPVR